MKPEDIDKSKSKERYKRDKESQRELERDKAESLNWHKTRCPKHGISIKEEWLLANRKSN